VRRAERLPLDRLAPYLLPTPAVPAPLRWQDVFGNDNPVELEVGFGKGLFLLTASQTFPGVNFLGIEIVRKYQLFTATRMAKRERTNVRLACADARIFLRDFIGPETLAAIHVYYPDPWWKKRHHKRRVFTEEFAWECQRALRPGGRLWMATDVEEYFRAMTDTVDRGRVLRPILPTDVPDSSGAPDYLTNFDRKARLQGITVFRAVYER
jgi:tRNA (guanine-N7-)-methyltransferase